MNLQTKIVIYTVGVIAVMVMAFTSMNLLVDIAFSKEHVRNLVVDLARGIAPTVRSDLQYKRTPELRRTVRSFSFDDSILQIDILDPQSELLTGTSAPSSDGPVEIPANAEFIEETFVWRNEAGHLYALAPVKSELGDTLGYVRVLASAKDERIALQKKLAQSLIFAGLFGIGGCFIGFIAGKKLTRPLEHLIQAAEDLASGNEPKELKVRSGDELGQLTVNFNRMVEKRREAESSLERSRQHLLFILRETPLGYIEWDLEFRVVSWNKAAEKIFGYAEKDAIGKTGIELIIPHKNRAQIKEIWNQIIKGQGSNETLNENIRADGTVITCQWNNTVIKGANGEITAIASLVNDVTENMNSQKTMRIAMEEAQKATQAKTEFLANMSHEIRTPMNGVIGITELLLQSNLDHQQRSYLEVIKSSGEMLITIINDILDLAKIESGKMDLTPKVFDLRQTLESAFDLFRLNMNAKNLQGSVHLDETVPIMVNGDPIRLRQIVYNLVSNSVKFTDEGSITIKAWSEEITSMRMRLHVSVEDTGPGIDASLLDKIFDPFSQADSSTTRSFGGTGLGLTICKRICKLMRGDVEIEKTGPEGTRFAFNVELQVAPNDLQFSTNNGSDQVKMRSFGTKDLNILIVEDNAVNRLVTKHILENLGYKSSTVDNGLKAVEHLEKQDCDLIFMDLQMPVMDGLTATARIREMKNRKPAIVALTASAIEGDREKCLAAGMDDYIAKPIKIESVQAVIDRLISRFG